MATLDQIYAKVEQLRDELAVVVASAKLNPKQITIIQGLSEINASLGVMRAGEFLALSDGEDPQDADGTGTFISALGRTFASKLYHIGGVFNGDLKWGANAITGELEAGDGAVNLTANGLSLYDGATEIGRFGNLNGFLSYTTDTYGMAMGDADQYMTYDQTNGLKIYGALVSDREILTADRTYYVATTGDDGNDGLTVGAPFLTIQKALDAASVNIDSASFDVIIQLATGTYTAPSMGFVPKSLSGSGVIIIRGNTTTPSNVVVQTDVNTVRGIFEVSSVKNKVFLEGMKFVSTASSTGVGSSFFVEHSILGFNNVDFSDSEYAHIYIGTNGYVFNAEKDYTATRAYSITGDAPYHILNYNGTYEEAVGTVSLVDTPALGGYVFGSSVSFSTFYSMTYTGSATGYRAYATLNSVISLGGVTLPGDTAGGTSSGGVIQ